MNNQLIDLYRAHIKLMVAGDAAQLGKLLTPDFYLVHMTGMKQSKAAWLAAIADGTMNYQQANEDRVELVNEHELIGQDRVTATVWGSHGTWRLQLHLYCVQVDDHWLIQHIVASTY